MLQLSLNHWINKLNLTINISLLGGISNPNKYKNNKVYDYNLHISVPDTITFKKLYMNFYFLVYCCSLFVIACNCFLKFVMS